MWLLQLSELTAGHVLTVRCVLLLYSRRYCNYAEKTPKERKTCLVPTALDAMYTAVLDSSSKWHCQITSSRHEDDGEERRHVELRE